MRIHVLDHSHYPVPTTMKYTGGERQQDHRDQRQQSDTSQRYYYFNRQHHEEGAEVRGRHDLAYYLLRSLAVVLVGVPRNQLRSAIRFSRNETEGHHQYEVEEAREEGIDEGDAVRHAPPHHEVLIIHAHPSRVHDIQRQDD